MYGFVVRMVPRYTGTLEPWYSGTMDATVVCGETRGEFWRGFRIGGKRRERSLEMGGCNLV